MKKITILMLAIFATLASCQKNETGSQEPPVLPNTMLVFNNINDFVLILDSVSKMSAVELKSFEETNNFQSFGRLAEETYYSANFEEFTENDFHEFLVANEDYVELSEDENGEISIDPAFYKNMYKYMINKDKMYEIGGNIYKVFKEGVVSVSKDRINELLDIKSSDIISIQGNDKFVYTPILTEVHTKGNRCGRKATSTKKYQRIVIELSISAHTSPNGFRRNNIEIQTKAQKRTIGIWWTVSRTTTYNFYIKYIADGEFKYITESGTEKNNKITFNNLHIQIEPIRMHSYDCWAITPSVDYRASIECNM